VEEVVATITAVAVVQAAEEMVVEIMLLELAGALIREVVEVVDLNLEMAAQAAQE
jgi:phosphopantetheine adenylyltransferase